MRCLQNKPFCIYGLPFYGLGAVGRVPRNSALKGRAEQSKSFLRQPGSLLAFLGGQAEQRVGTPRGVMLLVPLFLVPHHCKKHLPLWWDLTHGNTCTYQRVGNLSVSDTALRPLR